MDWICVSCVLEFCVRNYEMSVIGLALYVSKEWRVACQRVFDVLRIPRLTRLFICYYGGNTDIATKTRHALLTQLRQMTNIPNIPDDVSFSTLLDRIPTVFNRDMILASSAIPIMTERKNKFESIWGVDKENYSHIYTMMWKNQRETPVHVMNFYDEAMGAIYGTYGKVDTDHIYHIFIHLTFLVLWYEILCI